MTGEVRLAASQTPIIGPSYLQPIVPRTRHTPSSPGRVNRPVFCPRRRSGPEVDEQTDQSGQPVFYGIHVNDKFVEFINNNGLTTPAGIKNVSSVLQFPTG